MKSIKTYITEALRIKPGKTQFKTGQIYKPTSIGELVDTIKSIIDKEGNNANLNYIDVSNIYIFDYLFCGEACGYGLGEFNGDISKWNVSNAISMDSMFYASSFNGDLSKWDVSKVENMQGMFAASEFTGEKGDITNWDISSLENGSYMFNFSKYSGNVNNWKPRVLSNLQMMFANCKFIPNLDLSKWKIKRGSNLENIFEKNPVYNDSSKYPQRV